MKTKSSSIKLIFILTINSLKKIITNTAFFFNSMGINAVGRIHLYKCAAQL